MKTIVLMVIMVLSSLSMVHAGDIRVLILNKRFSTIPGTETTIKKIGNFKGELLVSGVRYLGNIEIWKGEKGLYLINELPIEDYVRGVVLSEVADGWEMEALKTQAVIARTYAVKHIQKGTNRLYNLTSSTLNQLYRGDNSDSRVSSAVMQTRGEILTYNGEPIEAFYHSTCGSIPEISLFRLFALFLLGLAETVQYKEDRKKTWSVRTQKYQDKQLYQNRTD